MVLKFCRQHLKEIEVNITSDEKNWNYISPGRCNERNMSWLLNLSAQDAQPECNHEEIAGKLKLRNIPQNTSLVIFNSVSALKTKRRQIVSD